MHLGWWLLIGYMGISAILCAVAGFGEKCHVYKIFQDDYGYYIKKRYWPFWQKLEAETCEGHLYIRYFRSPGSAEAYIDSLISKKESPQHIPYDYPKRDNA